ncbi:MAG TPA: Hsp20/alpha crystallin family protein [Thermoanaerobaculaceae bacterium]|nr:Hsp20/alpha crystallin family protein [Thermoanaerobaculaceae bacterium]
MRRRITTGLELELVQRHLEELLGLLAAHPQAPESGFSPAVDLREAKDRYVVLVDLPGVPAAAVTVTLRGRELKIAGRKPPRSDHSHRLHCHHMERGFGSFAVEVVLPGPVHPESVKATLAAGVLAITLPRLSERRNTEHTIAVHEGDS